MGIATVTKIPEESITEEYRETIEALLEYQAETQKQWVEIAGELGISQGAISQFKAGTYSSPHLQIPKIKKLIELSKEKAIAPKESGYKATKVSSVVYGLIKYSHRNQKITVAYGDAGIGKTMAVQQYHKDYPNNSIVIEADPNFNSVAGVYQLLALEMEIGETRSRAIQIAAMAELRKRDGNKVLIVDEAQLLSNKSIEALRIFTKKCGIGLCLVGNHAIYTKMVGSGKQEFAQLFSRMGDDACLSVRHTSINDIKLVFEDAKLDEASLKELHKVSLTPYGLRGAVDVFLNTLTQYKVVTYEYLKIMSDKKLKK